MDGAKNGYQATPNATLEQQVDTCPTCGSECNERDELTKAEREIERLRAEVDALRENNHGWLRANGPGGWIDALRADAERYRWLRDGYGCSPATKAEAQGLTKPK